MVDINEVNFLDDLGFYNDNEELDQISMNDKTNLSPSVVEEEHDEIKSPNNISPTNQDQEMENVNEDEIEIIGESQTEVPANNVMDPESEKITSKTLAYDKENN